MKLSSVRRSQRLTQHLVNALTFLTGMCVRQITHFWTQCPLEGVTASEDTFRCDLLNLD